VVEHLEGSHQKDSPSLWVALDLQALAVLAAWIERVGAWADVDVDVREHYEGEMSGRYGGEGEHDGVVIGIGVVVVGVIGVEIHEDAF
jgi:hypothetical protein